MKRWIITDEEEEAIQALEMVKEHLPRVREEPHYWKWVVIALHNSLQGFMVLALRGTNSLNVLNEQSAQELMAFSQGKCGYPKNQKLDNFLNLYEKIKKPKFMMIYGYSQAFKPSGTQTRNAKLLNCLRNEFIHFIPKGWSLKVSGLPGVARDCLAIISFLAFECGNIVWYDNALEQRTRELIGEVEQEINLVAKAYSVL